MYKRQGVVVGELIGGDAVGLHVSGIGVAARAGLGHVDGVDGGTRIAGRTDVMDAVAVDADGDLVVTSREALAVDAGVVLVQLVGAQARIVGAHQGRIGVAGTAQLRKDVYKRQDHGRSVPTAAQCAHRDRTDR